MKSFMLKLFCFMLIVSTTLFIGTACKNENGKFQDGFEFNSNYEVDGRNVFTKVSNTTETVYFPDEITLYGNASYKVYQDLNCEYEIKGKEFALSNLGNNKCYILATVNNVDTLYHVTIRRRSMLTVKFVTGNGETIPNQIIEEDSFAVKPNNLVKAGYTFNGWSYNFANPIIKNETITAFWSANTNTQYKVEYYLENLNDNNYTLTKTENLTGTTDTTAYANIKSFTGFTAEASEVKGNINGNGSTVLKVYYQRNEYTISVTSSIGGSVTGAGKYKYGKQITLNVTVNAGYTYKGLFNGKEELSKNTSYTFTVQKSLTIVGKWEANKNTQYKVEYYLENINDDNYTLTKTENLTGTTDTTAYADIKNFEYFTSEASEVKGNINGNGSTVLKVYYQRNEFTVTFKANGGTLVSGNQNQTVKYQGNAVAPTFEKTGYSYTFDNTYNNITENITVTAEWKINQYTLTIIYNNGEDNLVITQDYNTKIQEIAWSQIKPGYDLVGMDKTIPTVMPAYNLTITAKWNAIYNVNTGEITGLTTCGKTKNVIVIPEKIDGVTITSIGEEAFDNCDNLTSVTIGNNVTSIGEWAFAYCTNLTSITIPNSVTSIGSGAFYYCTNLNSISYNGTKSEWKSISKGSIGNSSVPATYVTCTDGTVNI